MLRPRLELQRLSGQTYYDYMREKIFLPLGMKDTDFYEVDAVVRVLI